VWFLLPKTTAESIEILEPDDKTVTRFDKTDRNYTSKVSKRVKQS